MPRKELPKVHPEAYKLLVMLARRLRTAKHLVRDAKVLLRDLEAQRGKLKPYPSFPQQIIEARVMVQVAQGQEREANNAYKQALDVIYNNRSVVPLQTLDFAMRAVRAKDKS